MLQAAVLNGFAFDCLPSLQDGLPATGVDVGRGEVVQAFVVAPVIVVIDEGTDLGLEIAWQIVVLQQDAVLECLMPALDLALRHRVIGCAADMLDPFAVEPGGEIGGDVARPVV